MIKQGNVFRTLDEVLTEMAEMGYQNPMCEFKDINKNKTKHLTVILNPQGDGDWKVLATFELEGKY